MDVDGEAKAKRKVSPLTFPFLLVVVIKERIRKKRGRPSAIFRPGRLLRVHKSLCRILYSSIEGDGLVDAYLRRLYSVW